MIALSLAAENLACVRGERTLFRDLSFTLAPGQGLVLTGPNGAGKTSLLRILAGLSRPFAGRVTLSRGGTPASAGEAVHMLGARDGLRDALTPRETLLFWRALHGITGESDATLAEVGLTRQADLPCGVLSAGQRRRLALGLLLLAPRPVWLLDEPLNALDSEGQALLRTRAAAHLAAGGVLVAATHQPLGLGGLSQLALTAQGGATLTSEAAP